MAKTKVICIDRKGERGIIALPDGTFNQANFTTFISAKSHVGIDSYSQTTTTDFPLKTDPSGVASMENDKDTKLTLGFQGAEGSIKISIPAPRINVEGGFVIRWGESRAYVPPVKVAGETGDDGESIATSIEGILGLTAGSLKFRYGRLVKKP
jgi:hypothetical protein